MGRVLPGTDAKALYLFRKQKASHCAWDLDCREERDEGWKMSLERNTEPTSYETHRPGRGVSILLQVQWKATTGFKQGDKMVGVSKRHNYCSVENG